jgi:hypothetical protein
VIVDHEVITNLWLLARMLAKTALYTGLGPGILIVYAIEKLVLIYGNYIVNSLGGKK